LRPLYESGAAGTLGEAVVQRILFTDQPPIPGENFIAAGLSTEDVNEIANIIDFYIRGNAMNLVAFSAMCRFMAGPYAPANQRLLAQGCYVDDRDAY
jgi:hypothetical protein